MDGQQILGQRQMPWGNQLLGSSNLYIHAVGCFITEIAQIIGTTPDVVNEKLKAIQGFAPDDNGQLDLVIWSKVAEAFPGWSCEYIKPYNNDAVLAALNEGKKVLVEVSAAPIGGGGIHAVEYIGNHQLIDPWTATVRPTSDFPETFAYVVFSFTQPAAPAETTYKGLDLTNTESVKAAIDAWSDVANGKYISQEAYNQNINKICEALGIPASSNLDQITQHIQTLKSNFAQQVQAQMTPDATQVAGNGPVVTAAPQTPAQPITIANIPASEKETLMQHIRDFENQIKNFIVLS